jgi:PAS domain S-box-containing protein
MPAVTDSGLVSLVLAALAGAALAVLVLTRRVWRLQTRCRTAELAQREAAARLRTLTEHLREAVITYGLDRQPRLANHAFELLTGYGVPDLTGLEFLHYIHPDDRRLLLAEWDRLDAGETIEGQEYRIVTRDGAVKWSAGTWRPLTDEAGESLGYLGTEFDITERKRTEHDLRRDVELFQAVMEVQQAVVAAGLDSRTVTGVIAERAHALTRAEAALIELLDGDELVPRVDTGMPGGPPRVETSLSGVCVRTGEVQRCDDTASDRRVDPEVTRRLGIRSLLAVPLHGEGRVLGVLKVISRAPHAFTDRDVRALRLMAGLMGAALEHAAFFESRQERLEERARSLQESEQRFKQLVDAAQEGIWVLDERDVTTYVNQRMAELLDYPKGEILGRPLYDFMDQSVRDSAREALARGNGQSGGRLDLRFRRRDGADLWAMVSASPLVRRDGAHVGTVAMVTDMTERRQAEQRLRRSADRLTVLHELDQAVLATRTPGEIARAVLGRLRRMLPARWAEIVVFDQARGEVERLAGFDGAQSLGAASDPLDAYGPPETWRAGIVRHLADLTGVDRAPDRIRQLTDAGLRSYLSAPLLADTEVVGQISLAAATPDAFDAEHREIVQEVAGPLTVAIQHARLREELARRTAEQERRLAERGAAVRELSGELDSLLGGLAHEVRTPVRQLHGFTSLLLESAGARLEPAGRHAAERIRAAAARLARLVDDLIEAARIGRQPVLKRPTDLAELVRELTGLVESGENGRRIEWHTGELGVVPCDPALVRVALMHLLTNAAKFTRQRADPLVQVHPIEEAGEAGLVVRDNGVGFDPSQAAKLFTLFRRLHPPDEFEGSGVGLAIVRRIAEKHGGRVWAEAEPGCGAAFYLTLGAGWSGR